jgi:hypothetical protein
MPANSFNPYKLDIVNQVLSELTRLPVDSIDSSKDTQLISYRIDKAIPLLLLKTNWKFAIKYATLSSPETVNPFPQYQYSYVLPADYGRMWHLWQQWFNYDILDGRIVTDQKPITFYYVVNQVDYDTLGILFERLLVLYLASVFAKPLTENVQLAADLEVKYEKEFNNAVLQNSMEGPIKSAPNDYDRNQRV